MEWTKKKEIRIRGEAIVMMSVEEFVDVRRQPPNTPESKMAFAYRKTVEDIESRSKDMWRFIRAKRVDGQLIPYFLPEAEAPLSALESAEKRLAEVQSDIKKFLKLMDGDSIRGISEQLHRSKLKVSNAEHDSRIVWEHALRDNRDLSPIDAEKLEIVQTSFRKRDKIKGEYEPLVAELQDKLKKANVILERYKGSS